MARAMQPDVHERLAAFRAKARLLQEDWLAILQSGEALPGGVAVEALGLVARLSALAARADEMLEASRRAGADRRGGGASQFIEIAQSTTGAAIPAGVKARLRASARGASSASFAGCAISFSAATNSSSENGSK